jgi:hypothetical protein
MGLQACLLIAILAWCGSAIVGANAQAAPRAWTVMIYMNGKNSLEGDALNNFHAMATVGSSDQVAYVAELGRPLKHYTNADSNWSGVYRFYIKKDELPDPKQAVEAVGSNSIARDMGKAATLADFIRWSKLKYPAEHYMLIVWNHGQGYRLQAQALKAAQTLKSRSRAAGPLAPLGGVRAVSSDDDTGSILYNSEVEGAIAANFPGQKLDVLGFDACLMAMAETAYAMAPSTKVMVASEELEPGDGWQYAHWMDKLVANPGFDGEGLGRIIIDAYKAEYGDTYLTTLSLLDLTDFKSGTDLLSVFADSLRRARASELDAFRQARADLRSYGDWYSPPLKTSIDLVGLLSRYEQLTASPDLKASSSAARASITHHILYNYASARSSGPPYISDGLAIYYPQDLRAFQEDPYHSGYLKANTDRPIAFVRDEKWADLIYAALGVR